MKPRTVAILLLAVLSLSACGQSGDPAAQKADKAGKAAGPGGGAPGAMPPPEVDVVTASRGQATITRELPGRLQAVRTAQVRARVEGIVEKRLFAEGSDVRAGQQLYKLDERTYRAAAQAAEADLELRRLTVARLESLLPANAVTLQEVDQARAQVKLAEATLSRARLDLENTSVPAPIAGRIGRTLVTEGALVGRGEATHLATVEQIDPIHVTFTQSGAELLRLRRQVADGKLKASGTGRVELLLEDGRPYPLPGRLLFADLAVDPNTGAVQMKAEFPNPKRELLPGSFVRVRMPQALAADVLKLPQRAVLSSPQGQYVLLVEGDGKVVPRPVKTGAMSGTDFLIEEGLAGGETVIVNGVQKARPGAVVKPVPLQPAAPGSPAPAAGAPAAPAAGAPAAGAPATPATGAPAGQAR
jgi:membrane fusion protein (multidrug efflux system)